MVFGDSTRIRTNHAANQARFSGNRVNLRLGEVMTRLSSGRTINRAEDGAARYSIATKIDVRVHGLNAALKNVSDTKSMLDIADAGYQQTTERLIELKSLAIRAASDTIGDKEREYIGRQMEQIGNEINTIANQAVYQDIELLNGKDTAFIHPKKITIQAGERSSDEMTMELSPVNLTKLFEGSNNLIGTGSRSYTDAQFYAGLWKSRDPDELLTESLSTTEPNDLTTEQVIAIQQDLETDANTSAEKILINSGGTIYTVDIPEYSGTPDANDLSAIASAVNSAGLPGLTAEVESDEIVWTNKSNQSFAIQFTDEDENDIGVSPLNVDAAEIIERIHIDVGGTVYTVDIPEYLGTPDADDLSAIASAVNAVGVPGVTADVEADELVWTNRSDQTVEIKFTDSFDNDFDLAPVSIDPAEVIEKVRLTAGGQVYEANLSTPQFGEPNIADYRNTIQSMGIPNLTVSSNNNRLSLHSTSFDNIGIEFINSDGDTADLVPIQMLSPKANQVELSGPGGTFTSSITEYTRSPNKGLLIEFEEFINGLEQEGFWAKYDEDFDRLIINNITEEQFTFRVTSTTAGTPGITPKLSQPPDELFPQGKFYFGRSGDDLASGNDFRMFMREVDRAIGDMNEKMANLGSIQKSLTNREELLSASITSNSAAHSRIMDADFAREQSQLIRLQILQETSNSALAQANFGPRSILGLIG